MGVCSKVGVGGELGSVAWGEQRRLMGEAVYRPLLVFLGSLAAIILLAAAGYNVLKQRLGVANAITLATALASLYWPVVNLLEHRRSLPRRRASAAALFEFLDP